MGIFLEHLLRMKANNKPLYNRVAEWPTPRKTQGKVETKGVERWVNLFLWIATL